MVIVRTYTSCNRRETRIDSDAGLKTCIASFLLPCVRSPISTIATSIIVTLQKSWLLGMCKQLELPNSAISFGPPKHTKKHELQGCFGSARATIDVERFEILKYSYSCNDGLLYIDFECANKCSKHVTLIDSWRLLENCAHAIWSLPSLCGMLICKFRVHQYTHLQVVLRLG